MKPRMQPNVKKMMSDICWIIDFALYLGTGDFSGPNVKEHATLSEGASVDHGDEVEATGEHEIRATDRGYCVSTCSASLLLPLGGYDVSEILLYNV